MSAKRNPARPRPRVVPLWRSRGLLVATLLAIAFAGVGAGWWSWQSGWVSRTAEAAQRTVIAMTVDLDFTVQEVLVLGRHETAREELLAAVGVRRGSPMFSLDLGEAKARVEDLPWVRTAIVERHLPNTIVLRVFERQPLALWQNEGRFALIDFDGAVITDKRLERFSDLLVVVGEDAPRHTAELLRILGTQSELMMKVKAAVRVGGRRWNLRLENGIDVRLPEEEPEQAWARLAEYDRNHKVLDRDIKILDLRLPDRVIVRRPESQAKPVPASDRET